MYQTEKVLAEEAKEMRAVFAEVMEELAQQDGRVVYLDADVINSIGMTGFRHDRLLEGPPGAHSQLRHSGG